MAPPALEGKFFITHRSEILTVAERWKISHYEGHPFSLPDAHPQSQLAIGIVLDV